MKIVITYTAEEKHEWHNALARVEHECKKNGKSLYVMIQKLANGVYRGEMKF